MRALVGGIAALIGGWLLFKGPERQLHAGRHYRATFRVTDAAMHTEGFLENLRSIMPPGAVVEVLPGDHLAVKFVAVNDEQLTDVHTPVGVLKLTRLEDLGQ